MLGTAIEGGVSTDLAFQGAGTAGVGLVAEGPSLGTSTVIVAAGAGAMYLGAKGAAGAAKNTGAVLNAMANKSGQSNKETGSYTNTHESGTTYDGKGGKERSKISGKKVEKQTGDKHTATEWKDAENDREAFKDESRRLDAHGGPKSSSNYNKIDSPGKKYRKQDGSK